MLSPPKSFVAAAPSAIVKRRRKPGKGQGDSSREASAESNDETATDNDPMADDTDAASVASHRNPDTQFRNRTTFEDSHHSSHRHKRSQTVATAATVNNNNQCGKVESNLKVPAPGLGYDASLESGIESSTSTYDGDVSSAPGPADKRGHNNIKNLSQLQLPQNADDRNWSRLDSAPGSSLSHMSWAQENNQPPQENNQPPQAHCTQNKTSLTPRSQSVAKRPNPNLPPAPHGILSKVAAEELQAEMKDAIQNSDKQRSYSINPPPVGRPVRIYADGVYDLFHYGHALQLRQCKLFFPQVYLMVGVCSDELVRKYKASPVLTSVERYESVANCKWVDQVIEDAPWQIDSAFIEKHQIDYVAHDEEPYVSLDSDDVYAYAKSQGKFLPTRRTDGVSTSELLQRIVGGYIEGVYDNKLEKIGAGDLCSNVALSDAGSGVNRGPGSRTPVVPRSPLHQTDAEMDDGTAM